MAKKLYNTAEELLAKYNESLEDAAFHGYSYSPKEFGYGVYSSYELGSIEAMKEFFEIVFEGNEWEVEDAMEFVFEDTNEDDYPLMVANSHTGMVIALNEIDSKAINHLKRSISWEKMNEPIDSRWYIVEGNMKMRFWFNKVLDRINEGHCDFMEDERPDTYDYFAEITSLCNENGFGASPYILLKRIASIKRFGLEFENQFYDDDLTLVEIYRKLKDEYNLSMAEANRLLWYNFKGERDLPLRFVKGGN